MNDKSDVYVHIPIKISACAIVNCIPVSFQMKEIIAVFAAVFLKLIS